MFPDDSLGTRLIRYTVLLMRSSATTAGIALLLGSGFLGLQLTSSRYNQAENSATASLAQLSSALTLVQSFRGDPSRSAPSLWTERLGVKPAADLWKRYGRSMWWQAWSQDGDAYLILPALRLETGIRGLQRRRVGSMEVLASDALHRKQLIQRLQTGQASKVSVRKDTLLGSCLQRLVEGPGVYWSADALASISGTLAPLLQQGREGCVRLQLQSDRLSWDGVMGNRPLASATQRMPNVMVGSDNPGSSQQSPSQQASNQNSTTHTVLQINGRRLDLILGTLLSRQIIQAPLEEHYGINRSMRSRISDLPFSLRLQGRESGAYKAGLQIQLPLADQPQQWQSILEAVSDRLQSGGFQQLQSVSSSSESGESVLWQSLDDSEPTTVGGWRIINSEQNNGQPTTVLSIGFGIEPDSGIFLAPSLNQKSSVLRITADPQQMTQLGLLTGLWPKPIRQAKALTMGLSPLSGSGTRDAWWRVSGGLTLRADS